MKSTNPKTIETETLKDALEDLYKELTRPAYLSPDPLQTLYQYPEPGDQEVVGLLAASLSYGQVAQILKSIEWVLDRLGPNPRSRLLAWSPAKVQALGQGFRHRWTDGDELGRFLIGIQDVLRKYGTLNACFLEGQDEKDHTVMPALTYLVHALNPSGEKTSLLSRPEGGSACKRLHMFLRWMVRHDQIDPGCWTGVLPARLLVPMDTHMHRISLGLRFTRRKQADAKTVEEVTRIFRKMAPHDPVRYDFALTRLGIRHDTDLEAFLAKNRKRRRV